MRNLTLFGISVACGLVWLAHQPQTQAYPKSQSASQPTSRRTARPTSRPSARPNTQRAVHPSSQPTTMGGQQAQLSGFIYGQLELDDSVKDQVKPGSVVFVVVRRFVTQGKGMLIAATKRDGVTKDSFPLRYVVKQSDAMMGAPLVGKVIVSARLDQDGDAISKQPGDITGQAEKAVMVGVNPVVIKLNQVLTQPR